MLNNETLTAAKLGESAALKQVMESVEATFHHVVDSNKNGFAHSYEIEDFKEEFPTIVWDAVRTFDETRGAVFNTYFHNFTFWKVSKNKKKVALGQFETPLSGFNECEELTDFMLEKITDHNAPDPETMMDIGKIGTTDYGLNEQESFIFESALRGLETPEIRDEFIGRYDVTPQYFYMKRSSAMKKIQKKQNLIDNVPSYHYN